jgi:NADH:ubiquinone oxidoreductase subunit 3 (subunit A)
MVSGTLFVASILIFVLTGLILGSVLVFIGSLTSYRRKEPEKTVPYECGELPVTETGSSRISVNYYPFAVAFLLFDVEAALLIPWVVGVRDGGWYSLIAASIFLGILLFGLFYALKSGGLKWE